MRMPKGSRTRPSESIIPRFAVRSMSAGPLRWVEAEGWEEAHQRAFAELMCAYPWGLAKPLPFENGKRRAAPEVAARWLLYIGDVPKNGAPSTPAVAAVEAHGFARTFRMVRLSITACSATEGWSGPARDALALLVSGVFLMTRADHVTLDPRTPAAAAQLARLGTAFGERRDVWSPHSSTTWGLDVPTGVATVAFDVSPATWWTSELGATGRKTLAYLEKRIDLEERLKPRLQRRRRGFLSRLSGLMRGR